MQSASHRQTKYVAASPLQGPTPLPLPAPAGDIEQARANLTEYGLCFLTGALSGAEVDALREQLERQAAAERSLGVLAPPGTEGPRQQLSNLVNKGKVFLNLAERPETDALAGYLLGKHFLVSSLTGGLFHGASSDVQPLHRDQGQVPATADFPAICNLFWLLDDFTPERGITCLQEVLDEASPKLKARMGLRTYGTLGMVSGTRTSVEAASLGNYDVEFPEYVIGEEGALHPMRPSGCAVAFARLIRDAIAPGSGTAVVEARATRQSLYGPS